MLMLLTTYGIIAIVELHFIGHAAQLNLVATDADTAARTADPAMRGTCTALFLLLDRSAMRAKAAFARQLERLPALREAPDDL